jgi:serine-type D-Ala-D-Ala carboxypeptidase/endopeptidase (penicillin-binding protein 4)
MNQGKTVRSALLILLALPATLSAQLPDNISSIIERAAGRRAYWGIEVADARTGEALVRHNAERLFVPASNTKLVVASAAAHYLDPDFRYRTTIYATGPVQNGVLRGDLVIYGRGDPTISGRYQKTIFSIWEAFADSLAAHGVQRIEGSVIGDESYFDTDYVRGDWESYDLLWWYGAPVSALGFNDNSIDFTVTPGAAGKPATVTAQPESGFFTLVNRSRTVAAKSEYTLDFTRVAGTDTIVVYGEIPLDAAKRTENFAVVDPARYAVTVLRETLQKKGIATSVPTIRVLRDSATSAQHLRNATVVFEHRSVPLAQIIGPVLGNSQNWFAEQLLKTIAREKSGTGSWDNGLTLERRFLIDVVGADSGGFRLRDASGLSSANLVTPHTFVQILKYMATAPRMKPALDALPISGAPTGSMRTRLTDLGGRVAAKTGSIGNVDSLSGYITTNSGRRLVFSIVANNTGSSSAAVRALIDDVVRAVATSW